MTPRDFALLAQEAYTATPDIGQPDSASRAIVRHTAGGLVIAFRGSDDAESWVHDFDVLTTAVAGIGNIHCGFWQAWLDIASAVEAAIVNQHVTLVGHSLGAALAVCAAVALTLSGKPPVSVYGFEPPRVTPELGVRTLLAKMPVKLYKNGNDVVPDLPPGWQHAAPLIHIGKAEFPIPNVQDHMLGNVIAALV